MSKQIITIGFTCFFTRLCHAIFNGMLVSAVSKTRLSLQASPLIPAADISRAASKHRTVGGKDIILTRTKH
jgi:hypothetical protein